MPKRSFAREPQEQFLDVIFCVVVRQEPGHFPLAFFSLEQTPENWSDFVGQVLLDFHGGVWVCAGLW